MKLSARARRRQSLQSCLACLEPDHVQMWIVAVQRTPSSRAFFAPGIVEASIVSDWLRRTNKAVRGAVYPDAIAESAGLTDASRGAGPGNNEDKSPGSHEQPSVDTGPDFGPRAWSLTGAPADVASPDRLLVTTCTPGSQITGHKMEDAAADIIPASPAAKIEPCSGVEDSTANSPYVGCHEPELDVNDRLRLRAHSTGCCEDCGRGGSRSPSSSATRRILCVSPDVSKGRPRGGDPPPTLDLGLQPDAGSLIDRVLRAAGVNHRDRDDDDCTLGRETVLQQCQRMRDPIGFPVSSCDQCISVAPGLLPCLPCLPSPSSTASSQLMIDSPYSSYEPHSSTLSVLDVEDERSWSRLRESVAARDGSSTAVGSNGYVHPHQAKSSTTSQVGASTQEDNQSRWTQWASLFDWSSQAHSAYVAPSTPVSEAQTAASRHRLQSQVHSVHSADAGSHIASGYCKPESYSPSGSTDSPMACKVSTTQAGVGGGGETREGPSAATAVQRDPHQSHFEASSTEMFPDAAQQAPLETGAQARQELGTAAFTALSPAEISLPLGESLQKAEASHAPRAAIKAVLCRTRKGAAELDISNSSSGGGGADHGGETCVRLKPVFLLRTRGAAWVWLMKQRVFLARLKRLLGLSSMAVVRLERAIDCN